MSRLVTIGARQFHVQPGSRSQFWDDAEKGHWEPETWKVFDRWIVPGATVIDLGAWIGPTSFYAALTAGHVYSIEADPAALEAFRANLAANPQLADRITLCPVCIAPTTGPVRFGSRKGAGDSVSSLLDADCSVSWSVPGEDWQTFTESRQIPKADFLKMDIEGGEYLVLESMLPWLQKHRPTLYLSLHPSYVGSVHGGPLLAIKSLYRRLRYSRRLLAGLSFYRHCYSPDGKPVNGQRFWLQCARGAPALVFTDGEWGSQTQGG